MGVDALLYSAAAAASQDRSPGTRQQADTVTVMDKQPTSLHGPNIAGESFAQDGTWQEGVNVVNHLIKLVANCGNVQLFVMNLLCNCLTNSCNCACLLIAEMSQLRYDVVDRVQFSSVAECLFHAVL